MKNFKGYVIASICSLGCFSSVYASNPASVEYVNLQIQNLQTQINNLPAGTTFTAGTGIDITRGVITNTSPGTTLTAGTGISIVGNVISATGNVGVRFVGEYYQGGVVYWIDPTSTAPNQHGLIADINDQSGTLQWSTANTTTGATLNGAYQGQDTGTFNTARILATPGATYPAASACSTSTAQGFTDWYLPSQMELEMMFTNQTTIRQTSLANSGSAFSGINVSPDPVYWSSNEYNTNSAWTFTFLSGFQSTANKTDTRRVRCVRAF